MNRLDLYPKRATARELTCAQSRALRGASSMKKPASGRIDLYEKASLGGKKRDVAEIIKFVLSFFGPCYTFAAVQISLLRWEEL